MGVKIQKIDPPRKFSVGLKRDIEISDCAHIYLNSNEQVTFKTDDGAEHDVCRKEWGFYATGSVNGRLPAHGLKAGLVKGHAERYCIMLVEEGKEKGFNEYLDHDQNRLVCWLDDENLQRISMTFDTQVNESNDNAFNPFVMGATYHQVHHATQKPERETAFDLSGAYSRHIYKCSMTGHFLNQHDYDLDALYEQGYVDATYGAKLKTTFEKIINLPSDQSDNKKRVARIIEFAARHFGNEKAKSVLDVGSGLCVFPYEMKQAGWQAMALDLDERQAQHARDVAGVEAQHGMLECFSQKDLGTYDVITFNKVLEHIKDPVKTLAYAKQFLKDDGFAYVELPDGEMAAKDQKEGYDREEFFIDHHHVFSMTSYAMLAQKAGFHIVTLERIREPSDKYTLAGFLVKA